MIKKLGPVILLIIFSFTVFCAKAKSEDSPKLGRNPPKADKRKKRTVNEWWKDRNSEECWENIAIVPVQFIGINGDYLIGQFSSKYMLEQINFKFKLDSGIKYDQHFFYSTSREEIEINQEDFLKRFKKDFWMVTYFPELDNALVEAHQFKNWNSLQFSYAQDRGNAMESVEILRFWNKIGIKPVLFHSVDNEKAYWIFVVPLDDNENNYREIIEKEEVVLENNQRMSTVLNLGGGIRVILVDHGVFYLHKNCVFYATKFDGEGRITNLVSKIIRRFKVKHEAENRGYFMSNFSKGLWFCYYNKDTNVLLRAVEVILADQK